MSTTRKSSVPSSRRTFLKAAAGITAGTVLARQPLFAQNTRAGAAVAPGRALLPLPKINPSFMITPDQALEWHVFKSQCGPTYAGSTGWKRFTDFLISKMPEFGATDFDSVEIPYDHYI